MAEEIQLKGKYIRLSKDRGSSVRNRRAVARGEVPLFAVYNSIYVKIYKQIAKMLL